MVDPSWSVVAAFAPVHGDVLRSPRAVSVVALELELEVGIAAAVPCSASAVVFEWVPATEHGEREPAVGVVLGVVAGPEIVPWIESE